MAVKETKNRGWWLPAGSLEPGEGFLDAAYRETKEEAGIDIIIKGILRVEHSVYGHSSARMRVIFFAIPKDEKQPPKSKPDKESEEACWITLDELQKLSHKLPGLRGPELFEWGTYIENGGLIAPLDFLTREDDPLPSPEIKTIISTNPVDVKTSSTKGMELSIGKPADKVADAIKCIENNDDINLRKLLIAGLNCDTEVNNKGWTMLHLAIKYNHLNIVTCLLLAGANISLCTHNKRNAIHFASQSTLEILNSVLLKLNTYPGIKKQELINFQDVNNETPLHFASKIYGVTAIYKLLVDNGADPNLKNNLGQVAMEICVKAGEKPKDN